MEMNEKCRRLILIAMRLCLATQSRADQQACLGIGPRLVLRDHAEVTLGRKAWSDIVDTFPREVAPSFRIHAQKKKMITRDLLQQPHTSPTFQAPFSQ